MAEERSSTEPGDYLERVSVSIRIADGGPLNQYVEECWAIEWFGGYVGRDQVVQEVESITTRAVSPDEAPLSHALDVTEKRTEWGASGAVLDVVLFLAAGGIVGGAAWDALKWSVRRWGERLKQAGPSFQAEPLSHYEVVERARWHISSSYSIPDDELTLVEHELEPPDRGSSTFDGPDGWAYTCQVEVAEGLVTITKITRRRR